MKFVFLRGTFSFFFFFPFFFFFLLILKQYLRLMKYNEQIINKTVACICKSKKYKIDKLLEMDAIQYCNLGKNSTKAEKLEVKKRSKNIYRAIQKIDEALGKNFLLHQDK